jgi:hypothetical protein
MKSKSLSPKSDAKPAVKFGRHRPRQTPATHPKLFKCLDAYLTDVALPPAPDTFSYAVVARTQLANILGNDELGDCTSAAACHTEEAISAAAGAPVIITREQAIAFYAQSTGYVPGDPSTDQGGDEITVLTSWKKDGLVSGQHKIVGFISIPAANATLVKQAMYLFENLYFGVELPDSYVNPFPSGDGFLWDVGTPNPEQGHAFCGVGANETGILIDTWGYIGTFTYAAIAELASAKSGGNLFVVLTQEIIDRASGKSPNGFDWATLVADINGLGGSVTVPPVAPPAPSGPVTLAQAKAWALGGLAGVTGHITVERARALVTHALDNDWPA